MGLKYDEYIKEHKDNVKQAYQWLRNYLPEIFEDGYLKMECDLLIEEHDKSKYSSEEYDPYDAYFYGSRSYQVVDEFKHAWLHHIHKNPHHWQHWVLINDNPEEGEIVLDMPDEYIIEMICDWWSFSWKSGDLTEIFKWYEEHSPYMKLSEYTRDHVEDILRMIKEKLESADESLPGRLSEVDNVSAS